MDGSLMKITYHNDTKKINKYIRYNSRHNKLLQIIIANCPYEQNGLRLFWIEEENDEIDICDQEDLDNFIELTVGVERRHLHVAKVKSNEEIAKAEVAEKTSPNPPIVNQVEETANAEKAEKTTTNSTVNHDEIPPAAGSYDFAVHDNVECDACLMAPIIGFRYKCIQCANYDLCQNCESKHKHSEHMMIRMPTNNCPSVIETYITGRSSGRKQHGKRSKGSCPFVKNGLSVVIDDDAEASQAGGEAKEQATALNGKERHHGRRHHRRHPRHNFLQNLYEMMHDLAEGGGAAAAAHAMGEEEDLLPACSTKTTTTTTTGPQTTTTQTTYGDKNINENVSNAQVAAQQAHEAALKAAEIAAKVAHETAVQAAKNIAVSMSATPSATTANDNSNDKDNKNSKDKKFDATTSPRTGNTSVPSSPSLEALTQFLDPQYMKTGIQILNNFSDMFAKMLDPLDNNEIGGTANKTPQPSSSFSCPFNANGSRKNSTASAKSTVSSQHTSINSEKNSEKEKPIEKQQTIEVVNDDEENKQLNRQTDGKVSSNVEIEDLGSDSESDSVSESFIKLDAPQEGSINKSLTSTASTSAQTTPPQSLDKSNVMDFAQLSADLRAHIADEAANKDGAATGNSVETGGVTAAEPTNVSTTANTAEPVVNIGTSTARNPERRAIPIYHADKRINNAIHAMMAMGFSNVDGSLTQLLETVNGNVAEALDLMSIEQNGGR